MSPLIAELIPLAIGASLTPVWIIIVLLLLRGEGGRLRALLFVAGVTIARLLQGLIFSYVFAAPASEGADEADGVISTLQLFLGIVLVITGVRKLFKQTDPDDPPPAWMTRIAAAGPAAAFGFGMLIVMVAVKFWAFTLGALAAIQAYLYGTNGALLTFLGFLLVAQLPLLLPILFQLVAPRQAGPVLDRVGLWLERYNREIVMAVAFIFGAYFLAQGVTGLMG